MIVAFSRFLIANDMAAEVRIAFRDRPHFVDGAPGFLGMEAMSPVDNQAEIWLETRWSDEQSYRYRHDGPEYHPSHNGVPKAIKLVLRSAEIQILKMFAH